MTDDQFTAGTYRAHFAIKKYFEERGVESHYPYVEVSKNSKSKVMINYIYLHNLMIFQITFDVDDPSAHYHIGLLITPWGFTTYRGS